MHYQDVTYTKVMCYMFSLFIWYGIGAVLSHTTTDGEHPIAQSTELVSLYIGYWTLNNYYYYYLFIIIHEHSLKINAVIFGFGKSHKFVYGRHLKIVTDHKPLIALFGKHKQIPLIISPRIQRWAITINSYNYSIEYKPGKNIPEADHLSRLPLNDTPREDVLIPGETVLFMSSMIQRLLLPAKSL